MQAMMMAGQALQLYGTISAGREADRVGQRNGSLLDSQADSVRRASYDREGMLRQRSARTLSDQRSALLANGVDPTSGTALIGVTQNTADAELDALTLRYEGLLQGRDLNAQADMQRYEGKARKRQAYISAAGQLLAGSSGYLNQKQLPAPVESRTIQYIPGR